MYKSSLFNLFFEKNRRYLIANTLTRAVLEVDADIYKALRKDNFSVLHKEEVSLLEHEGIVLPTYLNEKGIFECWLKDNRYNTENVKILLTLTTQCNLNCIYCYEKPDFLNSGKNATEEVLKHTILWIKKFAERYRSKRVHISFYGGEPSLRSNLIEFAVKQSQTKLKSYHVDYSMFTNGYFLPERLKQIILSNPFAHFQITLDGEAKIHNARRPLANGQPTFQIILKNIEFLLKHNQLVKIISNFDGCNYNSIFKMLEFLKKEFGNNNFEVDFNPVFKTPFLEEYWSDCYLKLSDIYAIWYHLYVFAENLGLKTNPLRIFNKGLCTFNRFSSFVIGPEGNIYKCIGFLGRKGLAVGNVSEDLQKVLNLVKSQIEINPWNGNSECTTCPLLPLCLGGCRFHTLVKARNIYDVYCHKKLIESLDMNYIKNIL